MSKKIKTYVVRIRGVKTSFKNNAYTKNGALKQVWRDIRGGYSYGIESFTDLKRKAIVTEV